MDIADLHDHEIAEVGRVYRLLTQRFSKKPNTRQNLEEMAKVAHDEFLKIGLVIDLKWENSLIIDPVTMQPKPITLDIIGRVPGSVYTEDGVEMFDHERKRHEVIRSKERGEDFLGQKEKAS